MGLFNLFNDAPDYDSIDAATIQTNLLMVTQAKERQDVIKKLRAGSLVTLAHTKRKGQNVYVVSDYKSGKVIGEISYGTSDYLAQNYKGYKMLGKVIQIGDITNTMPGKEVLIEYKVYL